MTIEVGPRLWVSTVVGRRGYRSTRSLILYHQAWPVGTIPFDRDRRLQVLQVCRARRRTACHSRSEDHLRDQLELQRCHYNFMRPHRSLRFGPVLRTPAMQAGLVKKHLTIRDVSLSSRRCGGSNVSLMAGGVAYKTEGENQMTHDEAMALIEEAGLQGPTHGDLDGVRKLLEGRDDLVEAMNAADFRKVDELPQHAAAHCKAGAQGWTPQADESGR